MARRRFDIPTDLGDDIAGWIAVAFAIAALALDILVQVP